VLVPLFWHCTLWRPSYVARHTNRLACRLLLHPSACPLSLHVLLPSRDSPNPSDGGGSGSAALQHIPDENHLCCHHPMRISILSHRHHLPPRSPPPLAHAILLSSSVRPLPLATISNRIHPCQTPSPPEWLQHLTNQLTDCFAATAVVLVVSPFGKVWRMEVG
jgi:hypothetical protein